MVPMFRYTCPDGTKLVRREEHTSYVGEGVGTPIYSIEFHSEFGGGNSKSYETEQPDLYCLK